MNRQPPLGLVLMVLVIMCGPCVSHAAEWYVDPVATGSRTGRSWVDAWTTFAAIAWNSVQPGDTIYLSGGSTSRTYTTRLSIGKSGTSSAPITIKTGQDSGHNGLVIFDGANGTGSMIAFGGREFVTINGNYNGTRHILVRNNSMAGDYALIDGMGSMSSPIQNIRLTYVEVANSGSGIRLIYAKGTEIDNCWIHNISCEAAIDLDGSMANYSGDLSAYNLYDQGARVHHNTIQVNNPGIDSGIGPDAIQGTHGLSVYNNIITGEPGAMNCSQHQDGVQLGGSFYKVYNNFFRGLANADLESDWADTVCGFTRVYNNVFAQSSTQVHSHGIEMAVHPGCGRLTDFRMYNNTWVDFWGFVAVRLIIDNPVTVVDNTEIRNNIVFNSGVFSLGNGSYTCGTGLVIDNNLIHPGSNGGTGVVCDGQSYVPTNTKTGSPGFVSYTQFGNNNDYHLTSSSAAIDRGTTLSAYFAVDRDGNNRPQGSAWDIGAYEWTFDPPPSPPENFGTNR